MYSVLPFTNNRIGWSDVPVDYANCMKLIQSLQQQTCVNITAVAQATTLNKS